MQAAILLLHQFSGEGLVAAKYFHTYVFTSEMMFSSQGSRPGSTADYSNDRRIGSQLKIMNLKYHKITIIK